MKYIPVIKYALFIPTFFGLFIFFQQNISPTKFSKDVYLNENFKNKKEKDTKIKFCFQKTTRIKSVVFPAESVLSINLVKINKKEDFDQSIYKLNSNRISFLDEAEIYSGDDNGITFNIIKSSISKKDIIKATAFYTVDNKVLLKEFNWLFLILSIIYLIIAFIVFYLLDRNERKKTLRNLPEFPSELSAINDELLIENEKLKNKINEDPRNDIDKAEVILQKIKEKFKESNSLSILSMDSLSDQSDSIPLGFFVVWIVISRIYIEETSMPSVGLEKSYSDLNIIKSLNGDLSKLLKKYENTCGTFDTNGNPTCDLFDNLNKKEAPISKETIVNSISKCNYYCPIFKDIAKLVDAKQPEIKDEFFISISNEIIESIKIAENNYSELINNEKFKGIQNTRSSCSGLNEITHHHLFAKILIGSEKVFENPHVESMIMFYELFNIPLFFIDINFLNTYIGNNKSFWYKSRENDLLIVNDEYSEGYNVSRHSWFKVKKKEEYNKFFGLLKNKSLNTMFAYDKLICNQFLNSEIHAKETS